MCFQGRTALHMAALRKENCLTVIQLLLQNGLKDDIKNNQVKEN